MSRLTKGYVIAIIGITFWSTTGVFIGYLLTSYAMPALLLAFWRDLFVCAALIPVFSLIRRSGFHLQASHIGFYVFYGLMLALLNSTWTFSVQANGAAVATVLVYSSAGFTVILASWFFKEKLGLPKIAAVMLSLSGCVLVSKAYRAEMWTLNPVGISTGLLSGVLFAGYSLMGKQAARQRINPWTSLFYSFAFGAMFLMLFNLFPGLSRAAGSSRTLVPNLPIKGWLILMMLSLIPTLLGYGLYNLSMNYLPAGIANLLATVEPAMTAVEAYIFLDERMTMIQIIGGLIIMSAVLIVQWEKE